MTQATQNTGASNEITGPLSEDAAADVLLSRFLPPDDDAGADASKKKKPSAVKKETEESDTSETDSEGEDSAEKPETEQEAEGDEAEAKETDDEEADDESEKTFADAEGTYVKIKVGDEEKEVPVKELTRLYGQEAALTKKSMEVAEQRKTFEGKLQEQAVTTNALLERAKQRFEPYSKIDFNLLAASVAKGELSSEEYTALRQAAQASWEDVQFLEKHTTAFMQKISDQRNADTQTKAKEAIKVLSGPVEKGGIEGWTPKLYDDIRAYAIAEGAPAEVVNSVVDPWAIKLMHAAMLYARGTGKAKGTVTVTKVNKTPKKIVKTTESPAASRRDAGKSAAAAKSFERLKSSGSQDDAAEALLARWQSQDSDD